MYRETVCLSLFLYCDESKSELARDLDDRMQSQNVPYGTSDDLCNKPLYRIVRRVKKPGTSELNEERNDYENDACGSRSGR
mgnify:FL=1